MLLPRASSNTSMGSTSRSCLPAGLLALQHGTPPRQKGNPQEQQSHLWGSLHLLTSQLASRDTHTIEKYECLVQEYFIYILFLLLVTLKLHLQFSLYPLLWQRNESPQDLFSLAAVKPEKGIANKPLLCHLPGELGHLRHLLPHKPAPPCKVVKLQIWQNLSGA